MAFSTTKAFARNEITVPAPKSYNEFVFPPDIHKYPLLISTFWTNSDDKIRDDDKKRVNLQISHFIEDEKLSRGIGHLQIDDTEGKENNSLTYRYIILTKPIAFKTETVTPPDPYGQGGGVKYGTYLTLCYYIKDRQTSKTYSFYGSPPRRKPTAAYDESDISPASPSMFFYRFNADHKKSKHQKRRGNF